MNTAIIFLKCRATKAASVALPGWSPVAELSGWCGSQTFKINFNQQMKELFTQALLQASPCEDKG